MDPVSGDVEPWPPRRANKDHVIYVYDTGVKRLRLTECIELTRSDSLNEIENKNVRMNDVIFDPNIKSIY